MGKPSALDGGRSICDAAHFYLESLVSTITISSLPKVDSRPELCMFQISLCSSNQSERSLRIKIYSMHSRSQNSAPPSPKPQNQEWKGLKPRYPPICQRRGLCLIHFDHRFDCLLIVWFHLLVEFRWGENKNNYLLANVRDVYVESRCSCHICDDGIQHIGDGWLLSSHWHHSNSNAKSKSIRRLAKKFAVFLDDRRCNHGDRNHKNLNSRSSRLMER